MNGVQYLSYFEKPRREWLILLLVAALVYVPFGLIGFALLDEEVTLFVPAAMIRDGLLPFRDYPAPVWQLNVFTHVWLCRILPMVHPHWISFIWNFAAYFGVALLAIHFTRKLARFVGGNPITISRAMWFMGLFFLMGPVYDAYHKYVTEALRYGVAGVLLLSMSCLDAGDSKKKQRLFVFVGALCLGLAGAALQHIGLASIAMGVGLLLARWFLKGENFAGEVLIPCVILILPLSIEILFFASKGALGEFVYWTLTVPSRIRGASIIFQLKRLVGFGISDLYAYIPLLVFFAFECGVRAASLGTHRLCAWMDRNVWKIAWGVTAVWFLLLAVSGTVRQPTQLVYIWALAWARSKKGDFLWDISTLANLASGFAIPALGVMIVYVLTSYTPAWLVTLHSDYTERAFGFPLYQFIFVGLEIAIATVLYAVFAATGYLWAKKGARFALQVSMSLIGLLSLYSVGLLSGLSMDRRFETAIPLSITCFVLLGLGGTGILPVTNLRRPQLRAALAMLIILIGSILLRKESGVADVIHRQISYAPAFKVFVDSEYKTELDRVRSYIDQPQRSLFVYGADAAFYSWYGKLPPSIALYHDAHSGTRVTPGWDEREVERLESGHVTTVMTLTNYRREDSFLSRKVDPIRDWIEAHFQPVYTGHFVVVWRRK